MGVVAIAQAGAAADDHQKAREGEIADDYRTWDLVEHLLHEDWSPEQISFWLTKEKHLLNVYEWIYQYILQDNAKLVIYIVIYVARNSATSAMVPAVAEVSCTTGYPLTNA